MPLIVEIFLTWMAGVLIWLADVSLGIARKANSAATRLLLWMDRKEGS